MRLQLYEDHSSKWRWRIRSRNGKIMATSHESFYSKSNAKRALMTFISNVGNYWLFKNDKKLDDEVEVCV